MLILYTSPWFERFQEYCMRYGKQHDESFITEQYFAAFNADDHKTLLLVNDNQQIEGVLSLIIEKEYLYKKMARVLIFHCLDEKDYVPLYAVLKDWVHELSIHKVQVFLDLMQSKAFVLFTGLGMHVERYINGMSQVPRKGVQSLPETVHIRLITPDEVPSFVEIRNRAFQQAYEWPASVEGYRVWMEQDGGQFFMLFEEDMPVACMGMTPYDDMTIGPLAVLPEYQGKGYGRMLLRYGINCCVDAGIEKVYLCVDTHKQAACALYESVGFQLESEHVCLLVSN